MTFHAELRWAFLDVSLDWLHARVAEVDECLVWKLAAAHGTDPQTRIGGREGGTILVRRMVWELVNERPFPANRIARCSCDTDLCVHPDHIVPTAKNVPLRGSALSITHRAKIAAAKRAKSRLTDANVAWLRATEGPLAEAAALLNIDPTYVSHIRLGKVRIDYAGPFTGLGARRG